MTPYVDTRATGCTELRVHGVSGTPPESSLGHPLVVRVAGDERAGFYRRGWAKEIVSEDDAEFRREAYSWGGLTSGNAQRALWLLLLPFMLLNLAFFMDGGHKDYDYKRQEPSRTVAFRTGLQQLLAFSLTVTYVLTAVAASVDLIGWQCGTLALRAPDPAGTQCTAGSAIWLNWLRYDWLDSPGRHITVAAAVPAGLVGLLWYLGTATWRRAELQPVQQIEAERDPDVRTPLEDRGLWNGGAAVHRLRALHIAGAFAVVAVFLTAPLLDESRRGLAALFTGGNGSAALPVLRSLFLALALLLLAAVVPALAFHGTGRRKRPDKGAAHPQQAGPGYRILPWGALALAVASGVTASWKAPERLEKRPPMGQLPWEVPALYVLVACQAGLLLLLFLSQLRSALRPPAAPAPPFDQLPRGAWRGLAVSGVAFLGWTIAGALAAGVLLRMAETLGTPAAHDAAHPGEQVRLAVPLLCLWVGAAAATVLVPLLVTAIGTVAALRVRDAMRGKVSAAYEPAADAERQKVIAGSWSRAALLHGPAQTALGWLLLSGCGVVVAAVPLFVVFGDRLVAHASWLVLTGNLLLTTAVLVLLWAGHRAYKDQAFRRTVGVVWDIGTFWPRATHPLAPPCYTERVIPDLLKRVEYLAPGGQPREPGVILSCHSQGTVIGAAVVLQAESEASGHIRLLTYGSPLTHLFVRFFPAYFNEVSLGRIGTLLSAGQEAADPAQWPWRNLYRPSDPIGGWVLADRSASGTWCKEPSPIDLQLRDPVELAKQPGDSCYPVFRRHSDYFADPAFDDMIKRFRKRSFP